MMEGTISLMQLAKVVRRARQARRGKLPYISLLTDPTTAASLPARHARRSQTSPEPGALIGFAAPASSTQNHSPKTPEDSNAPSFSRSMAFSTPSSNRQELKSFISNSLDSALT